MQQIGRYEIQSEIGRGGFGHVYRGRDPLMNRQVAIKVMNTSDDPSLLVRFRNEAAWAGHLRHENIVTVFDFGEENGVPYLVMELLEGMDLKTILDQNVALPLLRRVRILSQVASGLQHAHEHGIIHRDIKPANIMILKDGAAKIMDFGIARLAGDVNKHTQTGVVIGTLQYIAPEQFEGHQADTFSDLWAYGVISYQLLVGKNPFEAGDTARVIYHITTSRIPDIRESAPDLPEELCAIVARLLTRERNARYQSFEDVRIELNPIVERLEGEEAGRHVTEARVLAARGDLAGADRIIRQVLERQPSHTEARRLRDQVESEKRSKASRQESERLVKKGDSELVGGRSEAAVESYERAFRIDPHSSTARLKLDQARQIVERANWTREQIQSARNRLAAGSLLEAYAAAKAIIDRDPQNAEAEAVLGQIAQARQKQEESRVADVILHARMLMGERRFDEALVAIEGCLKDLGSGASFSQTLEEVRSEILERAAGARMDEAVARAGGCLRSGQTGKALEILRDLARENPRNVQVQEMLASATARWERETRLSEPPPKTPEPPPKTPEPPVLTQETVVARALEMSRQRESIGSIDEGIHVLDVALSRFPDAPALIEERRRLVARSRGAQSQPAIAAPVEEPSHEPQRNWRIPLTIAGVVVVAATLLIVMLIPGRRTPSPESGSQGTTASSAKGRVEISPSTLPPQASAETMPAPTGGMSNPVSDPTPPPPPPLSVPASVSFVYSKGAAIPAPQMVPVNRPSFDVAVTSGQFWLQARRSGRSIVLSVLPEALDPGRQAGAVVVSSGTDRATISALLNVEPAVRASIPETRKTEAKSTSTAPETERSDTKPLGSTEFKSVASAEAKPAAITDTKIAAISNAVRSATWLGARRGNATWTGTLPPGARLTLGDQGVLEGGGQMSVSGGQLPTVEIKIDQITPALPYEVLPLTSARRIVITNDSGAPQSVVRFSWSLR